MLAHIKNIKLLLTGSLLILVAFMLTACVAGGGIAITGPSVVVGSVLLPPGGTGIVKISVFYLQDLQSFQVGPTGAFTFDPNVIRVKSISGINGFQVFASKIDNNAGKVLFLVAYPGGGISTDGVVQLEVEAVGKAGDSTALKITQVDVLANKYGDDIAPFNIVDGEATIISREIQR